MKDSSEKIVYKTLVIGMYSHIELYPPSLNALLHLASLFEKVYVVVRNVLESDWEYPPNVVLIPCGKYISSEKAMQISVLKKFRMYLDFARVLRKTVSRSRPGVILLYDAVGFSLFNMFSWGVLCQKQKPLIWYHNHDVTVEEEVGRFSFMRLMRRMELRYLKRTDIFSLPNSQRVQFFSKYLSKKPVFIIPNYPSRFLFGSNKSCGVVTDTVRFIFQGHISKSNRVEDFVRILGKKISGRTLELHLAGPISDDYRAYLERMAQHLGTKDRIFIYGRLPYRRLPELTARCHIGLAIYGLHNTMVRTMGTASNKIFEYASIGLPVIMNKREDMMREFGKYSWAHFVGHDPNELERTVERIITRYESYSRESRTDFEQKLNFEVAFRPVLSVVREELKRRDGNLIFHT